MNETKTKRQHNQGLLTIAIFKWIKGCLLVLLALGLLRMVNRDLGQTLEHIAKALRVDPGNHYLAELLVKAKLISNTKLEVISGLTFAYSALFFVEGTGLFFEKRWAEYLTIIATASFIPIEVYEIAKHPNLIKVITLIVNLLIVAYLFWIIRKTRANHASHAAK